MANIEILQYPDPGLTRRGGKVLTINRRIDQIIEDMFETHYNANNCAALAATQMAFDDPPHITVIDFSPEKNQPLCLINPEIIFSEGETNEPEGCMSVQTTPVYEKVKRAEKIKVKALDREGNPIELLAEGYMAKCIQHEVDHLNGIIFLDHLSRLKRMRIDKRIEKILKLSK